MAFHNILYTVKQQNLKRPKKYLTTNQKRERDKKELFLYYSVMNNSHKIHFSTIILKLQS